MHSKIPSLVTVYALEKKQKRVKVKKSRKNFLGSEPDPTWRGDDEDEMDYDEEEDDAYDSDEEEVYQPNYAGSSPLVNPLVKNVGGNILGGIGR